MSRVVKVMIADDHEIVREGLETILSSQENIEVVGVAVNGLEAVTFAKKLKPDVILMDLVMPKFDGLQAIEEISKTCPKINILVLTSFADDERIFPRHESRGFGLPVERYTPGCAPAFNPGSGGRTGFHCIPPLPAEWSGKSSGLPRTLQKKNL